MTTVLGGGGLTAGRLCSDAGAAEGVRGTVALGDAGVVPRVAAGVRVGLDAAGGSIGAVVAACGKGLPLMMVRGLSPRLKEARGTTVAALFTRAFLRAWTRVEGVAVVITTVPGPYCLRP